MSLRGERDLGPKPKSSRRRQKPDAIEMVVVEPIKLNTALVVLGFCCLVWVYKKPKPVPGKANRLAQEEFLENIEQKLAENPDKIIERLWRLLKKIVLYNQYYERSSDFRLAILTFFKNIKRYRSQLESLLTLKFHTIGT